MSKELPYFKFYTGEWLAGDITMCDLEIQGLFINICAYYWNKKGSICLAKVKQRFNKHISLLEKLIFMEIIKLDENENIIINFLDEQINEFINISEKRAKAGSKGGKAIGKQKLSKSEAKSSNKDKIREDKIREDNNIIDKIIDLFKTNYELIFDLPYVITNKGKEKGCAGKILNLYKKKFPAADTEEMLNSLNHYFNACCRINDNWLSQNMSLPIIINKFNEINRILKNGKQSGKTGATDKELAEMLAYKFGSDRTET